MKDKIIDKTSELFMTLGFKSITMDDIAMQMAMSKKTLYKYFPNKETLIKECVDKACNQKNLMAVEIMSKGYNAIEENFVIKKMLKKMFSAVDISPAYQMKKYFPAIYEEILNRENNEWQDYTKNNLEKGIREKLYREDLKIDSCSNFYLTLLISISENTTNVKDSDYMELCALEYHTRAIATAKGLEELEKQLLNYNT